jgi:tRNA1Val (adenine37-N6)-methyltransferase
MNREADVELRKAALERELGEPVTCDRLTRDFVMFQRRRGHRHSTDDLLTAWYAVEAISRLPTTPVSHLRLLDLGSGIGSIGLAVLWCATRDAGPPPPLPLSRASWERGPGGEGFRALLTAIEAQELSFRLLRENIAANRAQTSVLAIHGDLRDASLLDAHERYDLVTGSPPYFDVKAGIVSQDSQRAHARFELRGDVRDYASAAARRLAPSGRFVLCFPTVQRRRAEEACEAAGLVLERTRDVIPKRGLPPLFSLFVYALTRQVDGGTKEEPFVVREENGEHTEALKEAQRVFGLGKLA